MYANGCRGSPGSSSNHPVAEAPADMETFAVKLLGCKK